MTRIDPKISHSFEQTSARAAQPSATAKAKGPEQQRGVSMTPPLPPAVGPTRSAPAHADPFVTFFVSSNDPGVRMPLKVSNALRTLASEHPGAFQKLEPSGHFDGGFIYKVRASLIPALREACGDACSATELAKLLAAPARGPVDASIIDVLDGVNPLAKLSALGALAKRQPIELDSKQQLDLVVALADAAEMVGALYGAVLRDTMEPRRAGLTTARRGASELEMLAVKLRDCVKLIEGFGTPAAHHMLDQLIDQGGGLVFDYVATTPRAARGVVDVWSNVMADALATLEQRMAARDQLDGAWVRRSYLGSKSVTVSGETWREDFPFIARQHKFVMLLGAKDPKVAKLARDAIFDAVLATDAKLPSLQACHKSVDLQETLGRLLPEERKNPEIIEAMIEVHERSYAARALTGVKEVTFLIGELGTSRRFEASTYDAATLVRNNGQLIAELLKAVKTPELKADLVNAAIGYYILSTQVPEYFESPRAKAVLADVIATATGPMVPAELAARAAAELARRDDASLLKALDASIGPPEVMTNPDGHEASRPAWYKRSWGG